MVPLMPGYNHTACKAKCSAESTTARMLCLMSEAENNFVTRQAHMKGFVAYTQNTSSSDYAEPAGGWGWECGSTYVPAWSPEDEGDRAEPDNSGDGGDVSCAMLRAESDGTIKDASCQEGGEDSFWSNGALLGPCITVLCPCTDYPLTAAQWHACARMTRRHPPPPPAWTGASRPTASCARGSACSEASHARTWWARPTAMAALPGPSCAK